MEQMTITDIKPSFAVGTRFRVESANKKRKYRVAFEASDYNEALNYYTNLAIKPNQKKRLIMHGMNSEQITQLEYRRG